MCESPWRTPKVRGGTFAEGFKYAFSGMGKSQWDTGYGKDLELHNVCDSRVSKQWWWVTFSGSNAVFLNFWCTSESHEELKKRSCPQRTICRGLAVCSFENSPVNAMSRKVWGPLFRSGTKQTLKKKQKQGQKSEEALTLKTQAEKDEPWEEGQKVRGGSLTQVCRPIKGTLNKNIGRGTPVGSVSGK